MVLESFYDVLTSLEKLGQVVDKDIEPEQSIPPLFDQEDFKVQLDNISYVIPDSGKAILDGISLDLLPKTRLLIQGESGSGKTTLLQIIAALIEPDQGNIYVNDERIKPEFFNYYRKNVGQSLKAESPFEGTLLENITYGDDAITKEQVLDVIELTGLRKFLKESPDGLDTIIYPEGKQISYTIAKKIVLARSLVKNPKLLVLRDPLDQFDPAEAERIMNYMTHPDRPWILVVVSNEEGWIAKCGQRITLKQGKIIKS